MTFSEIEAYGRFRYAGDIYIDKYAAFDYAVERLDWSPKLTFEMPQADALGDTTIEPEETLDELYRQRAQNLRDRFDYLVLMYSGGVDSHQMLMTFLKHGIYIDEVECRWPFRFVNRLNTECARTDHPLALMYEYPLSAVAGLQTVAKLAPRTHINLVDTSDDLEHLWSDRGLEMLLARTHNLNASVYHAVKRIGENNTHQRLGDLMSGKRVGVVHGSDKPYLKLVDGTLFMFFTDNGRSGFSAIMQYGDELLFDPIMFYWGAPRITVKQSHVIKRALIDDPGALAYVSEHRCDGQSVIQIPALKQIYPDWHDGYRQRNKALNNDDMIISTFFPDRPLYEFARDRNAYYNDSYGGLATVKRLDTNQTRRGMSCLSTRLYPIGELDVVSAK